MSKAEPVADTQDMGINSNSRFTESSAQDYICGLPPPEVLSVSSVEGTTESYFHQAFRSSNDFALFL
jgi:hypothetical protein